MAAVIQFAADCLQRRLKQQLQHCIDSLAVGVADVLTVVAADGSYGLEIDDADERLQPVVNLWQQPRRRIGLDSPSIGSEGVEVDAGIDRSHGNSDLS